MDEDSAIKCPECGKETNLKLHITVEAATISMPIIDGVATPTFELLLERQLPSDKTLLRYSDKDGKTKIIFFADKLDPLISCPHCNKMYTFNKEVKITCSDVDSNSP